MVAKLAQLTADQIVEKEKEFQLMIADPKKAEETWAELHEFFKNATFLDVQEYWETYWRWYTDLTWKRLNALPKDIIVNIAVSLQIPMASMIGYDVWERLMWYFGMRTLDDEDLTIFYTKVRTSFFNSKAFLGKSDNKDFLIRDLVEKVKNLNLKENNSLEMAGFYSKIQDIIKSQSDVVRKYIDVSTDDVVKELTSLSSFFIGVEPDKISAVVEGFLHPELVEAVEVQNEIKKKEEEELEKIGDEMVELGIGNKTKEVIEKIELQPEILKEDVMETPVVEEKTAEIIEESEEETVTEEKVESEKTEEIPVEKTVVEEVVETPNKEEKEETIVPTETTEPILEEKPEENKMSLNEIKEMIVSRFADKDGKIENIEGVLTLLHSLADDYKDENIRELYYFDEEKGDFSWNINLLT